jgi:hypothetical protein
MPLHPLARGDSDKVPLCELPEFFSIFGGILMQIREETASNLHTSTFSMGLRPCQVGCAIKDYPILRAPLSLLLASSKESFAVRLKRAETEANLSINRRESAQPSHANLRESSLESL